VEGSGSNFGIEFSR